MKVGKYYLGKYVEFIWHDPGANRVVSHLSDLGDLAKGLEALAIWKERGVIDDITEGVVRIAHSAARDPGKINDNEFFYSWVPEDLIESITVYEPIKTPDA